MGKRLIFKNADFSQNAIGSSIIEPDAPDAPDTPDTPDTPQYNVDSYIQDGLICQLDGFEKCDTANGWANRKGTSVYLSSGAVARENGFYFDGIGYLSSSESGFTEYRENMTIEVVFTIEGDKTGQQSILFSNPENTNVAFGHNASNQLCVDTSGAFGIFKNAPRNVGKHFVSVTKGRAIYDDVMIEESSGTGFASGKQSVIGGRIGSDYKLNSAFIGTIHSIRVYNKQLTEAEQRHNLEVDAARFGDSSSSN